MTKHEAQLKLNSVGNVAKNTLENFNNLIYSKDEKTILSYQGSSVGDFYNLAAFYYVSENNSVLFREYFFHAALAFCIKSRFNKVGVSSGIINGIGPAIAPLLSDHIDLINDIPNWKNKFHEENIKRGAIFYIIKNLIAHDYKTANDLWLKGKSHTVKKAAWYKIERKILRAMIDKDDEKTIEAIMEFLTPENIEKSLDDVFVSGYFFNTMTIAYLKLAYHLGMNIDIKHELVPKELVEFKPLDNYEIKYDFMKRDDIKDILDV